METAPAPARPEAAPRPRRISRSLLDPILAPAIERLRRSLCIPARWPPEALVLAGHAVALAGGVAFAAVPRAAFAGLLAALCVAANHAIDCIDGAHARATGQCRNGGELLDHFLDPLSFCAWMVGLGAAAGAPWRSLLAVLVILAFALLTNLRAKLTGAFVLSRLGPTEFKATLCLAGVALAVVQAAFRSAATWAEGLLTGLVAVGLAALPIGLWRAVRAVNRDGAPPDTGAWRLDLAPGSGGD